MGLDFSGPSLAKTVIVARTINRNVMFSLLFIILSPLIDFVVFSFPISFV
jgi:hypothetical protein